MANGGNPQIAVVAAPRLIAQLMTSAINALPTSPPLGPLIWRDTQLSLKEYKVNTLVDLFTGQSHQVNNMRLSAADVFSVFPVTVLVNSE